MALENNRQKINWDYLNSTMNFFKSLQNFKFTYIELPYFVPKQIADLTFKRPPEDIFLLNDHESILVGSAEQSFIYEMINSNLQKDNRYFSITPCFRDDPEDETHQQHFMKLELFSYHYDRKKAEYNFSKFLSVSEDNFNNLTNKAIDKCCKFDDYEFRTNEIRMDRISENQWDMFLNKIEIGSYGIRELKINDQLIYIVYGTGIAEPRYSYALNSLLTTDVYLSRMKKNIKGKN